jgi:hypothetical protein
LEEKTELDLKIDRLNRFMRSCDFSSLERIARSMQREQLEVMREYSGILARRIELFRRGFQP